jgi:hypothetical protein
MKFSLYELHFYIFRNNESTKAKRFELFSIRNHNDKSYGRGVEVEKGIHDINGFQIRFFTEKEIRDLAAAEGGFEILWIKEEYEEPVTLYLVHTDVASLKVNLNIIKSIFFYVQSSYINHGT